MSPAVLGPPHSGGVFQEPSAHYGPDGLSRPWPCEARLTAGAVPEAHGADPAFPAGRPEADGRGGASPLHASHGPSRLWETPSCLQAAWGCMAMGALGDGRGHAASMARPGGSTALPRAPPAPRFGGAGRRERREPWRWGPAFASTPEAFLGRAKRGRDHGSTDQPVPGRGELGGPRVVPGNCPGP